MGLKSKIPVSNEYIHIMAYLYLKETMVAVSFPEIKDPVNVIFPHSREIYRVNLEKDIRDLYHAAENYLCSPGARTLNELKSLGKRFYGLLDLEPQSDYCLYGVSENLLNIPIELCFAKNNFLCLKYAIAKFFLTEKIRRPNPIDKPPTLFIFANRGKECRAKKNSGEDDVDKAAMSIQEKLAPMVEKGLLLVKKETRLGQNDFLKCMEKVDIFHYFGHTFFDRENQRAYWELTDGCRITSAELSDIRNPPVLVFANSCGYHDQFRPGMENLGDLANMFLKEKFPAYIGSLFPVSAGHSARLAMDFYQQLLKGATVGKALLHARKKAFRAKPVNPLWAAYVLFGDPRIQIWKP